MNYNMTKFHSNILVLLFYMMKSQYMMVNINLILKLNVHCFILLLATIIGFFIF